MPRNVRLDLRGAPPVTGGFFDHIPPAHYKLTVASIEEVTSSTGKRMWRGTYSVDGGPLDGAKIGDNFVLEDNEGKPSKIGLGRLHFFLLCLALPVAEKSFNLDLDNLTGRGFEADVSDEEYSRKDGSTGVSSKVTKYYLPSQVSAVATPPRPAEAEVPADDSPPFDAAPAEADALEDETDDLFK